MPSLPPPVPKIPPPPLEPPPFTAGPVPPAPNKPPPPPALPLGFDEPPAPPRPPPPPLCPVRAGTADRAVVAERDTGERHRRGLVHKQRAAGAHPTAATGAGGAALGKAVGQSDVIDIDILRLRDDRACDRGAALGRAIDADEEDPLAVVAGNRVAIAVDRQRIQDRRQRTRQRDIGLDIDGDGRGLRI